MHAMTTASFRLVLAACLTWASIGVKAGETSISKLRIDASAERVFPSAQVGAPCSIVSVEGLGPLDGDYSLLEDQADTAQRRPAWMSTSEKTGGGHMALAYNDIQGVWTIGGAYDRSSAFVEVDSALPPAHSSMWNVYNGDSSGFERVGNAVAISSCTAVSVSTLPATLAECNGPYRLQAANIQVEVFAWSHVNDERCTMLHDTSGNCVVTMESQVTIAQASSAAAAARGALVSEEWWAGILRDADIFSSLGGAARVMCTSAGHTTRLVLDLVGPEHTVVAPLPTTAGKGGSHHSSVATATSSFKLTSEQKGSIVSSYHSSFHVQVSQAAGLQRISTLDGGTAGSQQLETDHDPEMTVPRRVKISVNGVEAMTVLDSVSIDGVREGTNVFEFCLLEKQMKDPEGGTRPADEEVCIAQTSLIIEVVSAETHVVRRRPSLEGALSSRAAAGGTEGGDGGIEPRRIVFVVDLRVMDGYKLSTLHLSKNMPSGFRASVLDLSCASGDLPVKDSFERHAVDVFRLCIKPPIEMWDSAQRQGTTLVQLLHSALVGAETWEDVTSTHPNAAQALLDVHRHLSAFDVLVMSNGGGDNDAFLLQAARLAGVSTRVVHLGAGAVSSHASPLFGGATNLIGPSHYVAHGPTVSRNEQGLSVKVCHPVMDAAEILNAARSCRLTNAEPHEKVTGGHPEHPERSFGEDEGGATGGVSDGGVSPSSSRFVMVGRVVPEKTPGMFVRAVAVLQRRLAEGVGRIAEAVVVGNGTLLGPMRGLARDLNATVRFTGFVSADKVPCEVRRATALVIPSTGPTAFEMVGPEAMLLGVPLVTFGFGGSGELVRHMENGILVAEPTPKALADALELLAGDAVLRDRLGAQAQLDALQALSLPEMVACFVDEFGSFANNRRTRPI
ncbi:unnamed protein product [Ectocarpus fasciculatus]